jgi:hypothetical protein
VPRSAMRFCSGLRGLSGTWKPSGFSYWKPSGYSYWKPR